MAKIMMMGLRLYKYQDGDAVKRIVINYSYGGIFRDYKVVLWIK